MTKDHPTTGGPDHNQPILTVGEISQALKRHLEQGFSSVRVRGEISGFKRAPSGHLYLSLKDENAVLTAVCWRTLASRLTIAPEDGMEVVVAGRITTYPGRSQYQLIIERMDLAGEGALLKLLEDRKKRLAAEGLFDPDRKKAIPYLPDVIGVVTSPSGAVIRDILHRLNDRFPRRVVIWPVLVQGEGAAEQIAAAIKGFSGIPEHGEVPRPDVLIVARGGGSLEDLWAFNEEAVVRAVAECSIPVISAVGHETDTTLIDFAADVRAPTPTAAAEMAVPVRMDLLGQLTLSGSRFVDAMIRGITERRTMLSGSVRALPKPMRVIEENRQRLDDWSERLANSLTVALGHRDGRLAQISARLVVPTHKITHESKRVEGEARALSAAARGVLRECQARFDRAAIPLESLSYRKVLERGFVLVHDKNGQPLASATLLNPKMNVDLEFFDGVVPATVNSTDAVEGSRRRGSKRSDGDQGTLW